jgi:hypothetical protein
VLTQFPELDALLGRLQHAAHDVLGDSYVGTYLQGSFALGAGDAESDADVLVVVTEPPGGPVEAELRRLHAELPDWPGTWAKDVEGSYADAASLRSADGLGVPWLYVDRGHREMEWSEHCNTLHTRWILHHHGIALDGPPACELVDEVPAEVLRAAAQPSLPTTLGDIRSWAPMDHAWTQRYVVQTCSRVLCTAVTGRVVSKAAALRWARGELDPRWWALLDQVERDRATPWRPVDPPRPGTMQQALAFAEHVQGLSARGWGPRA